MMTPVHRSLAGIANNPATTDAAPDASGAPVKLTLQPGAKIKITGLTAGDFAEFALPKGGVGYVPDGGDACLIPPEAAPTPTGSSGDYAPPGSDHFDDPAPDDEEG